MGAMSNTLKSGNLVIILGLLTFLTGCENDDGAKAPVLTLSGTKLAEGVYTVAEDEKIIIDVMVNAPVGLKLIRILYDGINISTEDVVPSEPGQINFDHNYILENWVYGSGPFTITFQAIDNSDRTASETINVVPDLPSVTFTSDNPDIVNDTIVAFVNQEYEVNYRYTFSAGFLMFRRIFTADGNTTEVVITTLPPTQGTSVTDRLTRTLGPEFLGLDISHDFEITDKFGNTASLQVPLVLSQKLSEIITGVELAFPSEEKSSKTFFSSNTGLTYSVTEVNADKERISKLIDFGYFYTTTDEASLTGPANYLTNPPTYNLGPNGENWPALNVTNFKRASITESAFDALSQDSQFEIDQAYETVPGDPKLVISGLQVGDIIAFKTSNQKDNGSKTGLLKVTGLTSGSISDGKIIFDVIVNQ